MEWTVDSPARLDAFLGSEGRMLSRARAQKAIEAGHVTVNGKLQCKPAMRLAAGDTVVLEDVEEATETMIHPVTMDLHILYEDAACMVLSKPAGIAVHPGAGMAKDEATLLHGLCALFQQKSIPFHRESVLVHRLDRETTGCILIAKTPAAHIALQKQFESRTVTKLYLAIVAGVPAHSTAKIDSPIGRSAADRTKMSVRGATGKREASTTYTALHSTDRASLVLCNLHTGRTHQVRVHLQSIGHPVLGDPSYHTPLSERVAAEAGIAGLCLHAWKLSFRSPATVKGKEVMVACPVTTAFDAALQSLGLKSPKTLEQ